MTRLGKDRVALGLTTLLVASGLMIGSFTGLLSKLFAGGADRTVEATFASAQQAQTGDPVRIGGVRVGRIDDIRLGRDGRSATVRMALDENAGPLYADARARLRWRTGLGASYALYLDRGTKAAGELGSRTIPLSRTENQVEAEDLVSLARGGARRGLQAMPAELAQALHDAQAPARALRTVADVAPSVAEGVGGLRGQVVDRDLRTLVSATSATVRALDTPDDKLGDVVEGAAATLEATAARRAAISATIARSPGVLARTESTVRRLDRTLRAADPLIATLHEPAGEVAPTLARLRPTVVGADRLLGRAVPLLRSLRPAVSALAGAAREGLPLLKDVEPSLDRLDDTILPFLAEVDPGTKRTTSQMIGPTFTGLGSGAAGQEDENGHFIRFPATMGSSPLYLPCQIYAGNPDSAKAIACKSLQEAAKSLFSYSPLGRTPGTKP